MHNYEDFLLRIAKIIFPSILALAIFDQAPFIFDTFSRGQIIGRDAYSAWLAGQLAASGHIFDIYNSNAFYQQVVARLDEQAGHHTFPYPPPALLWVSLFSFLPYGASLLIWTALGFIAFVAVIYLHSPFKNKLTLTIIAPVVLINIVLGQNGLIIAAIFVGALYTAKSKPLLSGLLIGLLSYKPQIAILLPVYLVCIKAWRTFFVAGLFTALFCLLPMLIWGSQVWLLYLHEAVPFQKEFLEYGVGIGQEMKPTTFIAARFAGFDVTHSYFLQMISGFLACMIFIFYLIKKRENISQGFDVLVIGVATCLISPYVHIYDLAVIAAGVLLASYNGVGEASRSKIELMTIFLWGLPFWTVLINLFFYPITPLLLIISLLFLIIISTQTVKTQTHANSA